jgi:hypothetical protein
MRAPDKVQPWEAKARVLYMRGEKIPDVADAVGKAVSYVRSVVAKRGWAKERRNARALVAPLGKGEISGELHAELPADTAAGLIRNLADRAQSIENRIYNKIKTEENSKSLSALAGAWGRIAGIKLRALGIDPAGGNEGKRVKPTAIGDNATFNLTFASHPGSPFNSTPADVARKVTEEMLDVTAHGEAYLKGRGVPRPLQPPPEDGELETG